MKGENRGIRSFFLLFSAIRSRFELANSEVPQLCSEDRIFDGLLRNSAFSMWWYMSHVEPYECHLLSDDTVHLDAWAEMYKVYCATQSGVGKKMTPGSFEFYSVGWKSWCENFLPGLGLERRELREKLMHLDDTLGEEMRKRFPPANRAF